MPKKLSTIKLREKKHQAYIITTKLHDFIKKYPNNIIFKKIYGGALGYYDYSTDEITIDYRKDIIPTIIHEFIHKLYPNLSETNVIKKEKEVMRVITIRQCKNILKLIANS